LRASEAAGVIVHCRVYGLHRHGCHRISAEFVPLVQVMSLLTFVACRRLTWWTWRRTTTAAAMAGFRLSVVTNGLRLAHPVGQPGRPGRVRLPGVNPERPDDERVVDLSDDDPILPEVTVDETDAGWGERSSDNDERLLDERPPHWE
jgi:hypothetical protein